MVRKKVIGIINMDKEKYNVRILYGIALLTQEWMTYREKLYEFACSPDNQDSRWRRDVAFREHMYGKYIKTQTPITIQFMRLDSLNKETVIGFCNLITQGLVDVEIHVQTLGKT